jgi:hypothetical protein
MGGIAGAVKNKLVKTEIMLRYAMTLRSGDSGDHQAGVSVGLGAGPSSGNSLLPTMVKFRPI